MEISSTEIVSSNTIFPLPKKYDTPSEKVGGEVGIWMIPNMHWSILLTRLSKKVIIAWFTKRGNQSKMLWGDPSLLLFQKKSIDTVKKI